MTGSLHIYSYHWRKQNNVFRYKVKAVINSSRWKQSTIFNNSEWPHSIVTGFKLSLITHSFTLTAQSSNYSRKILFSFDFFHRAWQPIPTELPFAIISGIKLESHLLPESSSVGHIFVSLYRLSVTGYFPVLIIDCTGSFSTTNYPRYWVIFTTNYLLN